MKATTGLVAAVALVASAAIGCAVETTTTECKDDNCVVEVQGDIPEAPIDGNIADLHEWATGMAEGNAGFCDAYFAQLVTEAATDAGLEVCQEAVINEAEIWEELALIGCNTVTAEPMAPPYEAAPITTPPEAGPMPVDGQRPVANALVRPNAVAFEPLTLHEWAWVRVGVDAYMGNELTRTQQAMLDTPFEVLPTVLPPGCAHLR